MGSGFDKQPASRPVTYQVLVYNSATVFTTKFGPSTQHIRVVSQVGGWATINNTTADSVVATSGGGVGMIITGPTSAAGGATLGIGTSTPEYFIVTPGQIFLFTSTSTTTGYCSVTEMS